MVEVISRGKAPSLSGDRVLIFTDASVKDGEAGIGIVIVDPTGPVLRVSHYLGEGWDSAMAELEAAIMALSMVRRRTAHVTLWTDCQGNIETIKSNGLAKKFRRFECRWVKGHAGHRWNETADSLAMRARTDKASEVMG